MMKRKTLLLIVSACFFASAHLHAADSLKLTLEQCIEYALQNNYSKQSVQLNEEIKKSSLKQSKSERLPSVSANFNEGVSYNNSNGGTAWNGSYDLSAQVTLFQGGQITNTIKQDELKYEQALLQTQQYDNELTIQVLQSFLTALGNEELLKYQESILESSEMQLKEGKVKFQVGQILESDFLLLESQYAVNLNNITATRINRDNNLISLKSLMSMELLRPIELVYPDDSTLETMLLMPLLEDVVNLAMETLPDVKISSYNVEIAETGLKISKASYYPTLSLNGGIGTGHVKDFNNFGTQLSNSFTPQAGITLSVPLFSKNKTKTNVKQNQIYLQQAEFEKEQSLMNIEQTLISEYSNVIASGNNYKTSEIKQKAYSSSFEAYTKMFKAGAITTVDLLQQQNNYISAMNEYIQDKYTFILQRKILDVYMGESIKM